MILLRAHSPRFPMARNPWFRVCDGHDGGRGHRRVGDRGQLQAASAVLHHVAVSVTMPSAASAAISEVSAAMSEVSAALPPFDPVTSPVAQWYHVLIEALQCH